MPHNAAAMRSHCGGVLRKSILTGEAFYSIVLHLRYLGHEGVARQAGTYDRTGAAFSLITRHVLFTIGYPTPIMYYAAVMRSHCSGVLWKSIHLNQLYILWGLFCGGLRNIF